MEYVRLDQELMVMEHVRANGGAFAVAIPGAEGRAIHARGQDRKRQEKVTDLKLGLMVKLNLTGPMDPSSQRYQQAMARLRDQELVRLEGLIEKEVSGLVALRLERSSWGAASRNTRSLNKRCQRRRKRIRELVNLLQSWCAAELPPLGSGVVSSLPASWSEEQIQQLFQGHYPWRAEGITGGGAAAALPHLAERYRDALAEVRELLRSFCLRQPGR